MVKSQGDAGRSQEETNVLAALALIDDSIARYCRLILKGNQDANSITETAVLKVQETNKIRVIFIGGICEIPEKPGAVELRKQQEIEGEWESSEGNKEANSADRIDQLNALRFRMQSGNKNPKRKCGKIPEIEMSGMGGIQEEETYIKYGGRREKNRNRRY